jgi:hypothetical protein
MNRMRMTTTGSATFWALALLLCPTLAEAHRGDVRLG